MKFHILHDWSVWKWVKRDGWIVRNPIFKGYDDVYPVREEIRQFKTCGKCNIKRFRTINV